MLELIARGVSIGFSAGITPGPLQALLFSSALTMGWRRAFPVIFSPLITDIPIAILCVFLLRELPNEFILAIQFFGGLFVLWLAYGTWKMANTPIVAETIDAQKPATNPLLRSMMVNLASPGPYLFWSTINGPLLVQAMNQSLLHALAFLISFYGTFIGLLAIQLVIYSRLGSLDPKITRRLVLFSAVVMVLFGLSLLWQAASGLMAIISA